MSVSITAKVYTKIDHFSGSNQVIQGLSGAIGFPATLIVDAATLFTHYGPMINDIRSLYGREPLSKDTLIPILKGTASDIVCDLVLDKVVGQVPVVGIPFNIMCAKAMSWRYGLMFAMLSARGESITEETVKKTCVLIRTLFPQGHSFIFKKPSVVTVEKLLNAVDDCEIENYEKKIEKILDNL